jgi:two-component system response regulator AtoC
MSAPEGILTNRTTIPGEPADWGGDRAGVRLLVIGNGSYETYNLPTTGAVTIGRAETADVRIDDPQASRSHARLTIGDLLFVEDLGSINGTRVRDRPIARGEKVAIQSGETIAIGSSVLIVHVRSQRGAGGRVAADGPTYTEANLADAATITREDSMKAVYGVAERASAGTINILIMGETGVGKEVLAKTIHNSSPRRSGPSICINCAALSESLLESELFGYEKGAFTGATSAKVGLLEAAEGGTLFLDEVGEMPLSTQAKLLRVLETREVTRLGSVRPRRIDVRFIAATNRDLEVEVERGTFRRDLYFRLNGVSIRIPPLRERRSEIRPLAQSFLREICQELGRPEPSISDAVMTALEQNEWPGNVRELKNVIERAVLLCGGTTIGLEHLPEKRRSPVVRPALPPERSDLAPPAREELPETTPEPGEERKRIMDALAACAGNQSRAAKLLNMPRRTFVAKLDRYRIPRPNKG